MSEQLIFARVKSNSKIATVTAFGGKQYGKHDWRIVPQEVSEDEVRRNPYLEYELRDIQPKLIEAKEAETQEKEQVQAPEENEGPGPAIFNAAKKLADEYGVDLGFVVGTGKNGAITIKDIRAYQESTSQIVVED